MIRSEQRGSSRVWRRGVAVIEARRPPGGGQGCGNVERLLLMRSRYSVDDMTRIFRRAGAQRMESWRTRLACDWWCADRA